MLPLSELTQRMLDSIIEDGWIESDRINAVVADAMDRAEARAMTAVMPIDLADALNEEIERQANGRRLAGLEV